MRRRSRSLVRAVAAAVALTALASLAACTSIPTDGAIRSNDLAAGAPPDQFIRVLARPPREGAAPKEIVDGFLAASASFDDDHAVARSFLTTAASSTWTPDLKVAIYDSEAGYTLAAVGDTQVHMLGLEAAGELNVRGQFRQPVPGSQLTADFALTRVADQWRIAAVPQGLVLSTGDVDRAFRTLNLYFLDGSGGVLVPDPIAMPAGQAGAPTSLVRELLRGPTPWLAPAVSTAFPAGTKLAVDSVPVEGGIARVDLDTRAVAATGDQRRALAAQLTFTLTQLPDVFGVRITLSGVPFAVPGIGAISRESDWESFDPDAPALDPNTYALSGGRLAVIDAMVSAVPGWFGRRTDLSAAAVALDGATMAGVVPAGSGSAVRMGATNDDSATQVYLGTDVSSLSYDRLGSVWVADRVRSGGSLWSAHPGRVPGRIAVEGLAGRNIDVVRVSRDGARIALVVSDSGHSRAEAKGTLLLGRIPRNSAVPTVSGLKRIESSLTDVQDVSWADDVTLLVVASSGSDAEQAYKVGIDGDSLRASGIVAGMRTVAAAPDRPLLAGTSAQTLWIDRGNGWLRYVRADVPIYPG